MEILTQRLLLRPICPEDVDALLAAAENPDRARITRLVAESSKSWRRTAMTSAVLPISAPMVRAVAEVLLGRPGIRSVWAATTPHHFASIRVMEKVGMVLERRSVLDGIDSVIYRARQLQYPKAD